MKIEIVAVDENKVWTIHGTCKKCQVAVCLQSFPQEKEPIINVDYIFEDKVCENDDEMLSPDDIK